MRGIVGLVLILAGLYVGWSVFSITLVLTLLAAGFSVLLVSGGVLALRSQLTGKELLSGKVRPKEIGKW